MKNITPVILFALICLSSCQSTVEVTIDNPTDTKFDVVIDGKETVTMFPYSYCDAPKLTTGNHVMEVNGDTLHFDIEEDTESVMLNPLQAEYIMQVLSYRTENSAPGIQARDSLFVLDSCHYIGTFMVNRNRVIVTDMISYNVKTPVPKQIESGNEFTQIKFKIYRKEDFKKENQSIEQFLKENPHVYENSGRIE